ncbi:MAG: N-acetylmuramoyl-L-alanine amidase [Bacteroidales bacterium]
MKYCICLLCLLSALPLTCQATGDKIRTVVIDPGHGGKDPGSVGKYSCEKNLALAVALKLGNLIKSGFPEVKVIYTRSDDRFIELRQRGRIANQNHADLFISIHCNSTDNGSAKGVETWIMGNHKNDANLKVAQVENSAILNEQNYEANYDNFDPNSPDAYIIFSLYQNAFMDQSLSFASKIQEQYMQQLVTPNRGIKQAGFLVLWACALPSVLTELGFISNPEEEKFLNSSEGQNKLAQSLFNAFKDYKYQIEGFNNQSEDRKEKEAISKGGKEEIPIPKDKPKEEIKEDSGASNPTELSKIVFKVQFASSSQNKSVGSAEFKTLKNVSKYEDGGLYKYCCGQEASLDSVQKILRSVQESGYKDAFIVVFENDKRISTQEALHILKERK